MTLIGSENIWTDLDLTGTASRERRWVDRDESLTAAAESDKGLDEVTKTLIVKRDASWRVPFVFAFVGLAFLTTSVSADEWPLPAVRSYVSVDKRWRFTVYPRSIVSPLAYFEDKVAGHDNAGSPRGTTDSHARGLLEHRATGRWQPIWSKPLVNEVSPVEALVSTTGLVATFDNWHSAGYGDDVVVLYDAKGTVVCAMGLGDFLPSDYVDALPRSVSSIWWGAHHRWSVDNKFLFLQVVVPPTEEKQEGSIAKISTVELAVAVASGKLVPPTGQRWADALSAAKTESARLREAQARWYEQFVAPLTGPVGDDEREFDGYLVEAFFRLDPDWGEGYPATAVLRLPSRPDYQASVGFLKDAIRVEWNRHKVVMLASPSQDTLVRVLADVMNDVPEGSFKDSRIYVAVDNAHSGEISKVLAASGATYIQLDPNKPIPQRKARIEAVSEKD